MLISFGFLTVLNGCKQSAQWETKDLKDLKVQQVWMELKVQQVLTEQTEHKGLRV